MKTVMKKLFSLMLVALLLVSAVPTALAAGDEVTCPNGHPAVYSRDHEAATCTTDQVVVYKCTKESAEECVWVGEFYVTLPGTAGHTPGAAATCTTAQTCTACGAELAAAKGHTAGAAATCTTAQTCTACGTELAPALGHTPGAAATCSAPQTCTVCNAQIAAATAHSYVGGKCSVCGVCEECGKTTCECCTVCKKSPCECTVTINFVDNVSGKTYTSIVGKPGQVVTLHGLPWVSGYTGIGWKINGVAVSNPYTIDPNAGGTTLTAVANYQTEYTTPTYPVNVYVRLVIGEELRDVRLIHTNSDMVETDKILDYLKHPDTQATLYSIYESQYKALGYKWSDNFYNAYGDRAATDNITTVNGSKSVYLNWVAEQDKVLVYVYTGPTCETYNYLYELNGYKADSIKSTISSTEVRNYLKKIFGSDISIKMFDAKGFYDYWHGKKDTATTYVEVVDGITEVHVRLYKASSSSSATADSTNPKTGDMIFVPAAVLGLSASALAVLFFLNKKRAVK